MYKESVNSEKYSQDNLVLLAEKRNADFKNIYGKCKENKEDAY